KKQADKKTGKGYYDYARTGCVNGWPGYGNRMQEPDFIRSGTCRMLILQGQVFCALRYEHVFYRFKILNHLNISPHIFSISLDFADYQICPVRTNEIINPGGFPNPGQCVGKGINRAVNSI